MTHGVLEQKSQRRANQADTQSGETAPGILAKRVGVGKLRGILRFQGNDTPGTKRVLGLNFTTIGQTDA